MIEGKEEEAGVEVEEREERREEGGQAELASGLWQLLCTFQAA